jgi:hypothetical protein
VATLFNPQKMHSEVSAHYRFIKEHAERHAKAAAKQFHATHKHAKKLLRRHKVTLHKVRHHSIRGATAAGIAAGLLVGPAIGTATQQVFADTTAAPLAKQMIQTVAPASTEVAGPPANLASIAQLIPEKISAIKPDYTPNMSKEQEAQFELLLKQAYGINAKAELEGKRLNATQGIIAGEQHMPLYPGDVVSNHSTDPTWFLTGIEKTGAYGYWAQSRAAVTQKDVKQEEYYMAAQTYLSPQWKGNVEEMYAWFKYRKMVIVNPETGDAVVTDIGDAGPGAAGRTYGASNESIIALGLGEVRTGHVYVFFVDDPNDTVPLGPLNPVQ